MIENAKNPALQFSGGKDSLATLYLLRPHWPKLTILYANAGDAFPETLALVESVRTKVKALHIATGNSLASNALPVDVVPIRSTPLGRLLEPDGQQISLRSRYECCTENLWAPMNGLVGKLDIDLLIRGQRDDEELRAPLGNGSIDGHGIPIWFPIRDWTADDVKTFLAEQNIPLPRFYESVGCSMDCMHCTAYLKDTRGKTEYLKKYHPTVYTEYTRRIGLVAQALKPDVDELTKTLLEIDGGRHVHDGDTRVCP